MITSRERFDFKEKCLLEKLIIKKSARFSIDFPNEACYLYVREGHVSLDSAHGRTTLASQDGVVLNCGYYLADFVKAASHDSTEVLAIHLHPEVLREIFRNDIPESLGQTTLPTLPARVVTNYILEKFIESLLFYFDNPHIVTDDILVLKVRELVLLLIQSTHAESIHNLFGSLFTRKTTTISETVKTHLYHNLSISELAKLVGLSLTSFKIEFAAALGDSPARYIRKKKIERAKELLLTSNFSIGEIAEEVGYKDASHFAKSFQSICGMSPTRFRIDFNVANKK